MVVLRSSAAPDALGHHVAILVLAADGHGAAAWAVVTPFHDRSRAVLVNGPATLPVATGIVVAVELDPARADIDALRMGGGRLGDGGEKGDGAHRCQQEPCHERS